MPCAAAFSISSARHGHGRPARFLRRRAGDHPQLRSARRKEAKASCAGSTWCRWPNSSSSPRPSAASAPAMSRNSAPPRPTIFLYEAVTEGRRYPGMEHWLPLFHAKLETLLDYLPGTALALEHLDEDAARERLAQIADYYEARRSARGRRDAALQAAAARPALSFRRRVAQAAGNRSPRQAHALRGAARRPA